MAIRELPPDLLEIAVRDINEDPKRRDKDLQTVKEWLKKQPHLTPRMDDQFIISFLRGCKFSLERTKEKLDTYYTFKALLPEFFANRDPMLPENQEILNLGSTVPLTKPDKLGRSMVLMKAGILNPKKHSTLTNLRVNYMSLEVMMLEYDRKTIAGDVVIVDFKGLTLDHMTQMTPATLKKTMKCFQDAYPIRPQEVHFMNINSVFETAFSLIKSLIKKKLLKRIHLHHNVEDLQKHISKDLLPADYGGELPDSKELAASWKKTVENYRDYFLEDEKYRSDEKRRPGKPKTSSDVFGVEGSFRALDVD